MVAGSLAIAAVLLFRGNYVLGLLIGGLALVRAGYLVTLRRRRTAFWAPSDVSSARDVLRPLARSEFQVAAGIIGLDSGQARHAFDQGRSLAEVATGAGVPVERLVTAVVSDASVKIDQDVAEGKMTQERALQAKARLPIWANRLVNFHKGDFQRVRGWA